jgi:hypothetical protein
MVKIYGNYFSLLELGRPCAQHRPRYLKADASLNEIRPESHLSGSITYGLIKWLFKAKLLIVDNIEITENFLIQPPPL